MPKTGLNTAVCGIEGCYETVIAALAKQIEQLNDELCRKQRQIDNLELMNEDLKIKLDGKRKPSDMLFMPKSMIDSDRDPFEGGSSDG